MHLPVGEARELLAQPDFVGEIVLNTQDAQAFGDIVTGSEFTLAERFAVDLTNDGAPSTNFPPNSTLRSIQNRYDKTCSTRPKELHATFNVTEEAADARFVLPLAAMGKHDQAVVGEYRYMPIDLRRRGGKEVRALGRSALTTPRILPNPFYEAAPATLPSRGRISASGIMFSQYRGGRLGGQSI